MSTGDGPAPEAWCASAAQYERRISGQRTREGLAAKRAQGVRLGRPSSLPTEVVTRIRVEHDAGAGWSAIARGLERDAVATAQGDARWYPAIVRKVALGQAAAAMIPS